ncbi:efflux RND transporter periplasmic adaptor subunit [Alterisphingorhabdus coralli]|uniref:Efflux RND transporter periplasmic adaptor subunit n=1 Tax=Alterisphingorhabdus coralli TaxID=3071408 RepID=A0AA97F6K4_9SPHN|nr:efflux RND transporter periplasmic adaptor subunit [Parasphingorhabdus sp. SCSIO 66989]WOE74881.1 efflux RND transporter periplasmic adaptor subunit [Parasphingorhabdus sp. SCSIO 66989]
MRRLSIIRQRKQTGLLSGSLGGRLALAGALLMLSACGGGAEEDDAKEQPRPEVTTTAVQIADTTRVLEAAGTVRYLAETSLGFTTPGKIASIRYVAGESVKRGELLASLDTTTVTADLASARAELERAEAEYGRIAKLFDQGWVTRARLDQSEAAAKAARAAVSSAGFARETSQIIAPSSGVILARNAEPGQIVQPGTAVLILGEAARGMVFEVPVIDSDVAELSIGMPAKIRLAALGNEEIEAQIRDIDGRADTLSGTFTVSFALPANPGLRSGQIGTAYVTMPKTRVSNQMTIPPEALFDVRADEGFVYVLKEVKAEGGQKALKAEARNVSIGNVLDDRITINTGLKPGERIIVTGHQDVHSGDLVAVAKSARPKASAAKASAAKAASGAGQ